MASNFGSSNSKNFSYANTQTKAGPSTRVQNAKRSAGGKKKKVMMGKKKGPAKGGVVAQLIGKARKAGAKIPGDKKM